MRKYGAFVRSITRRLAVSAALALVLIVSGAARAADAGRPCARVLRQQARRQGQHLPRVLPRQGRVPRLLGVVVRAVSGRAAALEELRKEFPADQFQVVAVNVDTDPEKALRLLAKHKIGYPSVADPAGRPAGDVRPEDHAHVVPDRPRGRRAPTCTRASAERRRRRCARRSRVLNAWRRRNEADRALRSRARARRGCASCARLVRDVEMLARLRRVHRGAQELPRDRLEHDFLVRVKPWERAVLTRTDMAWDPDPLEGARRSHTFFSKEASMPGGSAGGGGCGCN